MIAGTNEVNRARLIRVLIAGLGGQLAFGLGFTWGAVVPYVRAAGWPELTVALVYSMISVGGASGALFGGRLADTLPPRAVMWSGLASLWLGFGVALVWPTPLTFATCYSAIAIGFGGGQVLAAAVAATRQVAPRYVGTVGGILAGANPTFAVVEVPIVAYLAAQFGWIQALRIVGISAAVVATTTVAIAMPTVPRPHSRSSDEPAPTHTGDWPRIARGVAVMFSLAPGAAYGFVYLGVIARMSYGALWIATAALAAIACGNAIGRVAGGVAADYLGAWRALAMLLLISVGAMTALWLVPPAVAFVAVSGALGVASGGAPGVMSRLASEVIPRAPNTAFGILWVGYAAGFLTGPIVGAVAGSPGLSWPILSCPPALLLIYLAVRTRALHPRSVEGSTIT